MGRPLVSLKINEAAVDKAGNEIAIYAYFTCLKLLTNIKANVTINHKIQLPNIITKSI
jgi:hypothetical protein